MRIKIPALLLCLVALGFAAQAQAQCSLTDQISPNPNPVGNTVVILENGATLCNALNPFDNFGDIRGEGLPLSNYGTLNNSGVISIAAPLDNYGALNNSGGLGVNGSYLSNYGTFNNSGTAGGTSNVTVNQVGGTLNNYGQMGNSFYSNAGTWNNYGEVVSDAGATNSGVFNNYAGGRVRSDSNPLTNSGVLNNYFGGTVESGGYPLNNTGMLNNAGSLYANTINNSGQFSVLASGAANTYNYVQTAGTTRVDGTLRGFVNINGGILQGTGNIDRRFNEEQTVSVTVNGGTIAPGNSTGTLTILGNYTQTALGTFQAEIGGLIAGTQHNVLAVSGTATLAGTLIVLLYDLGSGIFSPHAGDTFDILTAEDIIGGFSTLSLAALGADLAWQVSYLYDISGTTDAVRLSVMSVANPIPEPEIYAMMLAGLGVLGFVARLKKRQVAAA